MKLCLDTSVFTDLLRKRPETLAKLARIELESLIVSVVVRAELLTGCLKSRDPIGERAKVDHLRGAISLVAFGDEAVEEDASIRAGLVAAGQIIGANDLMNAAPARSLGAVLVTENFDKFQRVPGLLVESWRSP